MFYNFFLKLQISLCFDNISTIELNPDYCNFLFTVFYMLDLQGHFQKFTRSFKVSGCGGYL